MSTATALSTSSIRCLYDLLQARRRNSDSLTFDELRAACVSASGPLGGRTAGTATGDAMRAESGSVLAARIVYCYLKRHHPWRWTRDRHDRLYSVAAVLDTLGTMPA